MKRLLLILLALSPLSIKAQSYVEIGNQYPIEVSDNKYVVNGFVSFKEMDDEAIFAKSLIWTVENISPKMHDGITAINYNSKDFKVKIELCSIIDSGLDNTYYCNATFRIADGKLLYHLTDIMVGSSNTLFKKVTPFETLSPNKNSRHRDSMDDFTNSASLMLNNLFDCVGTYDLEQITHWSDIKIKRIVSGMNRDECRLAQGKPQSIVDSGDEEQWMYSSSYYIFFKDNVVTTIIK